MKKFFTGMLALVAAAGFVPSAMAQDEEPMMQFYVHGKPVYNGDRIDITGYYEDLQGQFNPELTCVTAAVDDLTATLDFYLNETPAMDADWEYGAKVTGQICWPKNCQLAFLGKPVTVVGETLAGEPMDMQVHVGLELGDYQSFDDLIVKFELKFSAQFDEEEVEFVLYADKPSAGVEGIDADGNAVPVYYDLQGRQVANPSNGLYIVKTGSKVSKQFVR